MVEGTIFNIQRYCLHDGPGIRTTVFFKGCQLKCKWCENPESISASPQLSIHGTRCIGCGGCLRICPRNAVEFKPTLSVDRAVCNGCGSCAEVCPARALEVIGQTVSVDGIMLEVEKDRPFYEKSGGGVTVSGGEPTLQFPFLLSLLRKLKQKNIHTVVETNGLAPWDHYRQLLDFADLWYVDIKGMDRQNHLENTGRSNEKIQDNVTRLKKNGANVTIRLPIIPGKNDSPRDMDLLEDFLTRLDIRDIHLLPYHNWAGGKNEAIGSHENGLNMPSLSARGLEPLQRRLQAGREREVRIMQ